MAASDNSLPSEEDITRVVNDPTRLQAVHSNAMANRHTADEILQDLSRQASALLDTPVALISLVDSDHDVIMGQTGLPEPLATAGEITASPSFCQLTITHNQPLVITDALEIPTLRLFPSVAEMGVRAHIGIPLRVKDQPIGNCCVIDFKPRQWTDEDVRRLTELATKASLRLAELQQP